MLVVGLNRYLYFNLHGLFSLGSAWFFSEEEIHFEDWLSSNNISTTLLETASNDGNIYSTSFLVGNHDAETVSTVQFNHSIEARFVRIYPQAWYQGIGLRMEMYGCVKAKQTACEYI